MFKSTVELKVDLHGIQLYSVLSALIGSFFYSFCIIILSVYYYYFLLLLVTLFCLFVCF